MISLSTFILVHAVCRLAGENERPAELTGHSLRMMNFCSSWEHSLMSALQTMTNGLERQNCAQLSKKVCDSLLMSWIKKIYVNKNKTCIYFRENVLIFYSFATFVIFAFVINLAVKIHHGSISFKIYTYNEFSFVNYLLASLEKMANEALIFQSINI